MMLTNSGRGKNGEWVVGCVGSGGHLKTKTLLGGEVTVLRMDDEQSDRCLLS